jgi:hypothetical protein
MYYLLALALFSMSIAYCEEPDEQPGPTAPTIESSHQSPVKHKKPPKGDPIRDPRANAWVIKTGLPGDCNIHVTVKAKAFIQ